MERVSGVGGRVDEALRARRFDRLPSAEEFAAEIEPTNVPAVFHGAVKNWEAVSRWNPLHGGLDYLEERVGSAIVEAMKSSSAPVFYGDLRSHERVPLPFSSFITSCKFHLQNLDIVRSCLVTLEESVVAPTSAEEACLTSLDSPDQFYIAQVPILNAENKESCPLETLREDIQTPLFLGTKALASVNFWMNRARSRSSAHYDPHHNLLCVIAGWKRVVLWPPSACPLLYPMPIYGEASNHSAVDIENPDLSVHLRAKHSMEYSQKIILHSGDALFIPEGWFHQVDSNDLTIAVNFWWKSNIMSNMLEHMDAYYLRRICNRLVDKEMNQMLNESSVSGINGRGNHAPANEASEGYHEFDSNHRRDNLEGNGKQQGLLQQLEPHAVHVLYELISLVHDTVKVADQNQAESASLKGSSINTEDECMQIATDNLYFSEDLVSRVLGSIEPLVLRKVLLAMVHHFPRTLEALVLHMLSPKGAEVLTRKFDEMDQQTTQEQQGAFYKLFYSVFEDQYAAMDAILHGKELFAFQAFRNVLDQYLGVQADRPKYFVGRSKGRSHEYKSKGTC